MPFAIKAKVEGEDALTLAFNAQKTMYGGKAIAKGDVVFIFDSESDGGVGFWGRGLVTSAAAVPKSLDRARQTPRVSITVGGIERARQAFGRADLKAFKTWNDGRPETELNFKFYRQATNKIVGLSPLAAEFLERRLKM